MTREKNSRPARNFRRKQRCGSGRVHAGQSKKYSWLYDLLLVAVAGYLGVFLLSAWENQGLAPLPANAAGVEKTTIAQPSKAKADAANRVAVERDLFGSARQAGRPVKKEIAPNVIPLAERSVGLELVGTVIADEPQENMAVIESLRTNKQAVYREGDKIGRILIKQIVRNNVVLAMGAQEKRLTMEILGGTDHTMAADRNRLKNQNQRTAQSRKPDRQTALTIDSARRGKDNPISIHLAQPEVIAALADTPKATQAMKIGPYLPKGEASGGFLIRSVKPGSIFSRMGLRTGDVVTGLNQEPVIGVEQAENLFSRLREGGKIALQVKRAGRIQTVQLSVD